MDLERIRRNCERTSAHIAVLGASRRRMMRGHNSRCRSRLLIRVCLVITLSVIVVVTVVVSAKVGIGSRDSGGSRVLREDIPSSLKYVRSDVVASPEPWHQRAATSGSLDVVTINSMTCARLGFRRSSWLLRDNPPLNSSTLLTRFRIFRQMSSATATLARFRCLAQPARSNRHSAGPTRSRPTCSW